MLQLLAELGRLRPEGFEIRVRSVQGRRAGERLEDLDLTEEILFDLPEGVGDVMGSLRAERRLLLPEGEEGERRGKRDHWHQSRKREKK